MEIGTKLSFAGKIFPNKFYDSFFIGEYGKIEALRATRYNSTFSIVLISIEAAGISFEEGAGFEQFKALVKTVLDSVRNCDVVGMSDDAQITVILPETDHFGSLTAIRKISRALGVHIKKDKAPISVIISNATYPKDGRGYGEVLSTAIRRGAEKKESLWERLNFKNKLFWEILGDLSGKPYSGLDNSSFDAGSGQELNEFFIDQINNLIVKEISRTPQKKGILYFASKNISKGLVKLLGSAGAMSSKIFLVGETDSGAADIKNATPILLDDPRLRETFFTLFLNEDAGYGLICKENWGATFTCFHTSDPFLVEGLITKLQNEYSLQEQLG
ncbi:MAG: hypothetical protein HY954_10630 [Deltaproteobacteria bacterium]|nr:hypothetical protein [Deltaproteobacteria bacterium]